MVAAAVIGIENMDPAAVPSVTNAIGKTYLRFQVVLWSRLDFKRLRHRHLPPSTLSFPSLPATGGARLAKIYSCFFVEDLTT